MAGGWSFVPWASHLAKGASNSKKINKAASSLLCQCRSSKVTDPHPPAPQLPAGVPTTMSARVCVHMHIHACTHTCMRVRTHTHTHVHRHLFKLLTGGQLSC